jgi:hypothetical protein
MVLRDAGICMLMLDAVPADDVLGLFDSFTNKFSRTYFDMARAATEAIRQFALEVESGTFPWAEHYAADACRSSRDAETRSSWRTCRWRGGRSLLTTEQKMGFDVLSRGCCNRYRVCASAIWDWRRMAMCCLARATVLALAARAVAACAGSKRF